MRPEDFNKAKQLIQNSKILSAVERAEWMQLLPQMNDKQVWELSRILTPPPPAAAQSTFKTPPNLPTAGLPEITTSKPFYEQEIAAPKSQPQRPAAAPDPAELQKKVASIVREMDQRKSGQVLVPPPAPPPPPLQSPPAPKEHIDLQQMLESDGAAASIAPDVPADREEQPANEPDQTQATLNSAADFSQLSPAFLDNRNLNDVYDQLKEAIARISKKESPYSIVENFERSPLQSSYVSLGAELLNDPNPNRTMAYEKAQAALAARGIPALNKEEFEFLTDFRSELQQLY